MSDQFNADEMLTMAEQIETNRTRFYRQVVEVLEDQKIHRLLLDLVNWEQGDEKVFSTMRD